MTNQATGATTVHLKIGECIFTRGDVCIHTVLGSCVAVTLYHADTGWCGMCHAVLPGVPLNAPPREAPCKYVDAAITQLLDRFRRREVRPQSLKARLYGGAFCVISPGTPAKMQVRDIVDVGGKNVRMARQILMEEGVRLVTESTLGERSRKIMFHTASGRVVQQFLGPLSEKDVPAQRP